MPLKAARSTRDHGLTLVEMLVVLAILGVVTGATLISLRPTNVSSVKVEARYLANAIEGAADMARIRDEPSKIVIGSNGYKFVPSSYGSAHKLAAGIGLVVIRSASDDGMLGGTRADVALPLDGSQVIELTLTRGSNRWAVTFDGIHAGAYRLDPNDGGKLR